MVGNDAAYDGDFNSSGVGHVGTRCDFRHLRIEDGDGRNWDSNNLTIIKTETYFQKKKKTPPVEAAHLCRRSSMKNS